MEVVVYEVNNLDIGQINCDHVNLLGGSSSSFCSISSICYVDWGGTALYLHGSYL